jgi:hypothetical protein
MSFQTSLLDWRIILFLKKGNFDIITILFSYHTISEIFLTSPISIGDMFQEEGDRPEEFAD